MRAAVFKKDVLLQVVEIRLAQLNARIILVAWYVDRPLMNAVAVYGRSTISSRILFLFSKAGERLTFSSQSGAILALA